MSYVKNNLLEGETVTYTARPSWWSLVPLIILSAILFWTIVMPLVLIYCVVQFKFTEIAITNRRIFYKKGVIGRDVHEINLNRVEGIIIQQGWTGRIFNFGSVNVHGTGAGNIVLSDINNPVSFRQAVQRQIGLSDITTYMFVKESGHNSTTPPPFSGHSKIEDRLRDVKKTSDGRIIID